MQPTLAVCADPLLRDAQCSGANRFHFLLVGITLAASLVSTAQAVPSFARQMNMQCIACHTEFPILSEFGRQFKLSGYTLSTGQTELPPIAFMVQPGFTQTQKGQDGGAAPGFRDNNNTALNQFSLFYSGRLFGPFAKDVFGPGTADFVNHFGVFLQVTYDGVGKQWTWDNAEIRYANSVTIAGRPATYGVYLNNNPTLQDPWNSTPAWTFPFSSSGLAPTPSAAALIDGGLAQQVGGAGAYLMLGSSFYVDVAAYRTLGANAQTHLGVDPSGESQISGLAPYWRLAWISSPGSGRWEVGVFGLDAGIYPGRDQSAGKDRVVDLGIDSEYQNSFGRHDITALVSWIHEHSGQSASQALGLTEHENDHLGTFRFTLDYLFDKTLGLAGQYFAINGSADALRFADSRTGSPASNGFIFQLNYLPLNKHGGPDFWPRSNVKLSLQYTAYTRFDGAKSNFDGAGRNAADNNTLYLETWIMF